MKKFITLLKKTVPLVVLTVCVATGSAQTVTIPASMRKSIVNNRLPGNIQLSEAQRKKIMIKKIDLSASSINFSVVKCKGRFDGTVIVEGVVKNTGGLAWSTGANQQSALLYEDNGGTLRLVASQPFQNLAPGAQVKVSYSRLWNKSSPAEGEFPPRYILVVSFDPDIYIDGNDNNDDSNNGNNKLEKSSSEVNANWPCK